jgi:hypothetical protein
LRCSDSSAADEWDADRRRVSLSDSALGIILLVVGAIGVLLSLIFWSSWGGFRGNRNTTTVVEAKKRQAHA